MSNRKLIKSLVNEEGAKLVNRESILEEVLIVFEISSACPLGDSWRLEGGVRRGGWMFFCFKRERKLVADPFIKKKYTKVSFN